MLTGEGILVSVTWGWKSLSCCFRSYLLGLAVDFLGVQIIAGEGLFTPVMHKPTTVSGPGNILHSQPIEEHLLVITGQEGTVELALQLEKSIDYILSARTSIDVVPNEDEAVVRIETLCLEYCDQLVQLVEAAVNIADDVVIHGEMSFGKKGAQGMRIPWAPATLSACHQLKAGT